MAHRRVCSGVGLHQFHNAVFPPDPGVHPLRDGRDGHRELSHVFRLQTLGLTLGGAWVFGHVPRASNRCSGASRWTSPSCQGRR